MGKYLDSSGLAYFWNAFKTRLLPSGGSSGQVLSKSSATSYDVGWVTPSSYSLPAATTSSLGGVKVGSGLAVASDGTISLNVASANGVSF